MPRRKQTALCMICLDDPCSCEPKAPQKKKVKPSTSVKSVEHSTPLSTTPAAPIVDISTAMREAAAQAVTITSPESSASPVLKSSEQHEPLDDELLNCLSTLAPILHPDELRPYQAEIWKRRRRNEQR